MENSNARPSLEDCPPEIIEAVVERLQMNDVLNLRLCNRTLSSLAAQETFKSYYRMRRVYLHHEALEKFYAFAKCGGVARYLENIILVGEAIQLREWDETRISKDLLAVPLEDLPYPMQALRPQQERDEALHTMRARLRAQQDPKSSASATFLLSEAFKHLKRHGRVRSVALEVAVVRRGPEMRQLPVDVGDWETIWAAAAKTFHLCMVSLAESRLRVERLDVFCQTQRCSLSCRELCMIPFDSALATGLVQSLSTLKSLSISVSENTFFYLSKSERSGIEAAKQTLINDTTNFVGIQRLLAITPALKDLQIHWYGTHQLQTLESKPELFFQHVSEAVELPPLESCVLRGVCVTGKALLKFVQRLSLRSLSMEDVRMMSGTFAPALDYCTRPDSPVEYIFLDDLFERKTLVFFDESSSKKFPLRSAKEEVGGQTLERVRAEVRRPITYKCPAIQVCGSPDFARWRRSREMHYGPPNGVQRLRNF